MTSRFASSATLPSSMPARAIPCPTASPPPGAIPIAGPSRMGAGSRYRRMCRGNTTVVPAKAGTHTLVGSVTEAIDRLRKQHANPAAAVVMGPRLRGDDKPSRVEHDDAAHRLAGFHRGKTFVDFRQFQLGGNPVLQMQLAAH